MRKMDTAFAVMPGLGPGIHEFAALWQEQVVDGRDKPGHDGERSSLRRGEADEAIQGHGLRAGGPGLFRFARNDGGGSS
jgi:hypothetical protein